MDALLNWLAQGALLALAAAAALALIPRSRPEARCAVVWTAYLGLVALPAIPPVLTLIHRAVPEAPTAMLAEAFAALALLALPDPWWAPAALASLWMVWFGAHLAALARAWSSVRAARRRVSPCSPVMLMRLPHWSRTSAFGRRVRVVLSSDVRTAAVLGGGRPVIALARRTIDDLDPGDLDRLLVHAWAHVQRRDDVAHWTQRVSRAVAGWHPAGWWLDRQIGVERDAACDQVAARVTGSARAYAAYLETRALLDLRPVEPPAVPAAPLSRLRRRVERLMAATEAPAPRPSRLPAFACATGLVAFTIAAGHVRLVVEPMSRPVVLQAPTVAWTLERRAVEPTADRAIARPPDIQARDRQLAARAAAAPSVARPAIGAIAARAFSEIAAEPLTLLPVAVRAEPRMALAAAVASPSPGSRMDRDDSLPIAALQKSEADAPAPRMRAADAGAAIGHASKDAGVAIGRASKEAGLATAGLFSRLGKRIAGSF